ncbi:MAG: cytidylate kinase-like family protein [Solirubrobacteraceae bacterium]
MIELVAISGAYGAGGSRVGRELADRLGVPFLDRAIPAAVAEALAVPLEEVVEHDGRISRGWPERILSGFLGQDTGAPTWLAGETMPSDEFKRATEEVLCAQARTGRGVILGRAATVVLRDRPEALRVRLDGPRELRILQASEIEGIDAATAKRRLDQTDKAHSAYVGHFYGADICDPTFYDLVLDSTAISLRCCVELIAHAATLPLRDGAPRAARRLAGADGGVGES